MSRLIPYRNFTHSIKTTKKFLSTAQIIRQSCFHIQTFSDKKFKKQEITTSRLFNSGRPNSNGVEKVNFKNKEVSV